MIRRPQPASNLLRQPVEQSGKHQIPSETVAQRRITEAEVKLLLKTGKLIFREVYNNYAQANEASEIKVVYDIRRKDNPTLNLHLQFSARLERPTISVGPRPTPGIALRWHNSRIRGISWRLQHDVIQNGVVTGKVRGWYEHQWTDTDEDRFIVDINRNVKRADFWALVRFCLKRWNIEDSNKQYGLGE